MKRENNLLIQGQSITQMYNQYCSNLFLVNRKYQRKLCWTIEEKRNFIDTIMNNLPVPLFLIAEKEEEEGIKCFEIIDGMQRLDAIFSLIEQKYSLKGGYFNLNSMPDTILMVHEEKLIQKMPILDLDICRKIANYPLPISISTYNDQLKVEESFKRINSTGKHLSPQELRQAGANGNFPELIRMISAEIRGDISNDRLLLNEMSKISLSNYRLDYGVFIDDIFWVKNGIIDVPSIRESKDEEIIAFIISDMLLDGKEKDNFTQQTLNQYYAYSSNPLDTNKFYLQTKIENAISRVTIDIVKKQFDTIISIIDELMVTKNTTFKKCLYKKNVDFINLMRPFQVVFMSIFNIVVRKNKKIIDKDQLYEALQGIGDDMLPKNVIDELFSCAKSKQLVATVEERISKCFSTTLVADPALDDWTRQCTNIIMKSKTEQNLFDFKVGFIDFGKNQLNCQVIDKVLKTLTAINNIGPNNVGYVIIGIADSIDTAEKHKKIYNSSYKSTYNFAITGVEDEALTAYKSVDRYVHSIKEHICNCVDIDQKYKTHIIQNLITPLYYGKQLIIFKTNYNEPVMFGGKLYKRMFSDVQLVNPNEYNEIFKKFYIN